MRVKLFSPVRALTDHAYKSERVDAIMGWLDRNVSMRLQGVKLS